MTNQVNLVAMDFDPIKASLKDFLKQQSEFKDYNFEGSGLTQMLNALATDAQRTAYLANMIANESNLGTAVLRDNIVSGAKNVGYVPKSRKASRAILSVMIDDPANQASSLLLPRGTRFIANTAGRVYSFVSMTDYNLYLNETTGLYENKEIEVFEGTIKAVSWTVAEDTRFVMNDTKVDTSTLKVAVFPNYNTSNGTVFTQVYGLERVKNTSEVFWVNETDSRRFEIVFGDGVFGKKPANTNVVYAEYLSTNGIDANGLSGFSLAGSFAGYNNSQISIEVIDSSNGGMEAESSASIKFNAPRARAAQGKATVPEDFASLVETLYPYSRVVNSWGGDQERPVKYGKVFICVIPEGGGVLTDYAKQDLVRKLKARSVAGITPVFVDAEYIKFNLAATVNIRANSIANLKPFSTSVKTMIEEFFESRFYDFNASFYYSNLVTEIENFSRSITSTKLNYELSIDGLISRDTFDFKNAILPGTVRTTKLNHPLNTSALAAYDSKGLLYLDKVVIGKVNYDTGVITISDTTITSDSNTLEVFVTPANDDVIVNNRSVITLDTDRLSIELKAV